MPRSEGPMMMQVPGKAIRVVMLVVFALWLSFAIGLNWGSVSRSAFFALAGNTDAVLHGQVWRLLTAPLLQNAEGSGGLWSLIFVMVGLWFLAPSLEEMWGSGRMLRFLGL